MNRLRRLLPLAALVAGCVPPPAGPPGPASPGGAMAPPTGGPGAPVAAPIAVRPLPGGLDRTPVLNSNSPEVVKEGGVLVSTRAGGGTHLDYAFEGPFEVFTHHVADDPAGADDAWWLAVAAQNDGPKAIKVELLAGASWLSRPDAPFLELAPRVDDPTGRTFAGPGSRVATDMVHGRSPLAPTSWTLAPGERRVLLSWPMPTTNNGVPNRNGRSGLLRMKADGPVRLAEVALPGRAATTPGEAALLAAWDGGVLAGPRDAAPTIYDPASPPTSGAFRYGRVAGVAVGARWTGKLFERASEALAKPGDRLGFPIASPVLNTVGTHQVQAPAMARRYPDTAVQAQGSYGVTYELALPLDNPDDAPRAYAIALVSPLKVSESNPTSPAFVAPAGRRVHFRGPVRLAWTDEAGNAQATASHLVLRDGEDPGPFATVTVPPKARYDATLTLVYPADCTPPQLVTVARSTN